jgi:hypothetical protein
VNKNSDLPLLLITQLADALAEALRDPGQTRERVQEIESHAPKFPEVRFCKGCVLPIVDTIATSLLHSELGLSRDEIRQALLCEGQSTLSGIYSPKEGQSGFGGVTWGDNWQRVSKSGQVAPADKPGYRPCPDFGIVSPDQSALALLGEVKYVGNQGAASLAGIIKELRYYMGLPVEPDKKWHYRYGVGVLYAAAGDSPRRLRLITDYWRSDRFALISLQQ